MTKYFLTALFLLTILSCNIKTESSHNDKAEITGNDKAQVSIKEKHLADSLRYVLKISDSIRVLINKTIKGGSYLFVIIDYNKHSIFHNNLKKQNNKWEDYVIRQYKNVYDSILPKVKGLIKNKFPNELKGRWYPVFSLEKQYYLYEPCQFYFTYEINDTSFVYYDMDGNYPRILLECKKTGAADYHITTSKYSYNSNSVEPYEFDLKLLDKENGIFLYKDSAECSMIINSKNINKLPIILEGCSEITDNQDLKFDEIPCK